MNSGDETYEADIRWTTHGVAHVRAADWGGVGFGQGYACARDHIGTIADQIVKVRSERARFHGEGPEGAHVASDFGYKHLGVVERAPALRDAQPPRVRQMVAGYVAGYNAWLAEARATDRLPAWCADAEWLRPMSELDMYAYLGDAVLMGSGRNVAQIMGRAEAPGADGPVDPSPMSALGGGDLASNGWAFGGDATASGHGLVVANPHFPWHGEARFWECHLTVPGEIDVYGSCLLGIPGVQMGFNRHVAWAHTFSNGHRFTMYRLDLVPGAPTRYRYGTDEREMTSVDLSVEVLGDDGTVSTVERTLWSTHHGPMVNLPLLGWGLELGFAYRDANLDNTAMVDLFTRMCTADDLDEFQAAFADTQAMPWVNTLAADASGRCWYADASATPALTPEATDRFVDRVKNDFVAALLIENRVALLDGSEPGDDWEERPGARSPGLVPHAQLPQVERRDFVVNSNDSHWLSNPAQPLEGYPVLCGFERTPRSLRTRQNIRLAQALADTGSVTCASALDALLGNASLSADLLLDDVVARCRHAGSALSDDRDADVKAAAEVLAAWDRRSDLASVGAALWREFMASFPATAWKDKGPLFATAFDPADPVATPVGLEPVADGGGDPIVRAMADAVAALRDHDVAIDAPLGDVQWAMRGTVRVPVHGGGEGEGLANVLAPIGALPAASLEPGPERPAPVAADRHARTGLAAGGYQVTYGTSFLMAVELTDDGPVGVGLLAYGQHGTSTDGAQAYADKAVRPLLFEEEDIEADTKERATLRG